jgi:hypothetical protein
MACGGGVGSAEAPRTFVVEVPPAEALPPPVAVSVAVPRSGGAGDDAQEVPIWRPPPGHLDPCATWTSEKTLFDCNAENEFAPDAGAPHPRKAR